MLKKYFTATCVLAWLTAQAMAAPVTQKQILEHLNRQELAESFSSDYHITNASPVGTTIRNAKIFRRGKELLRIETEPSLLKAIHRSEQDLGDLVIIRDLAAKKPFLFLQPARHI